MRLQEQKGYSNTNYNNSKNNNYHLLSIYFGPGATLSALPILTHLISWQLFEVGGILSLTLHKRKLRHKVVCDLPKRTQQGNDGAGTETTGVWPPSLFLYTEPCSGWGPKCTQTTQRSQWLAEGTQWGDTDGLELSDWHSEQRMFNLKKAKISHFPIFVNLSWKQWNLFGRQK